MMSLKGRAIGGRIAVEKLVMIGVANAVHEKRTIS